MKEEKAANTVEEFIELSRTHLGSMMDIAMNTMHDIGVSEGEFSKWIKGEITLPQCNAALQGHIKDVDPEMYGVEMFRPNWRNDIIMSLVFRPAGSVNEIVSDTKLPKFFVQLQLVRLATMGMLEYADKRYKIAENVYMLLS